MKKRIDIFVIATFIFISFLMSFAHKNEIFPFFQWNLYSWTYPRLNIRTFLVTNKSCDIKQAPLFSFLKVQLENQQEYSVFHWDYYRNQLTNRDSIKTILANHFCQKGVSIVRPVLINANPTKLWNKSEYKVIKVLGSDIEIDHSKS